jgi:hypothetical protein
MWHWGGSSDCHRKTGIPLTTILDKPLSFDNLISKGNIDIEKPRVKPCIFPSLNNPTIYHKD